MTKGVFKEVFWSPFLFLHNQKWDLSTAKVPFSQYAKAVFKEVSKEVFEGVFKEDNFCIIIGTLCSRCVKNNRLGSFNEWKWRIEVSSTCGQKVSWTGKSKVFTSRPDAGDACNHNFSFDKVLFLLSSASLDLMFGYRKN